MIKVGNMTQIITSTQNQYVKQARSLAQKKFRQQTGLFLVEGANLLKDMPLGVEVEYVLATQKRLEEADAFLSARTDVANSDVFLSRAHAYAVSDEVMQYVADTVSPYGICAVCKMPKSDFAMPKGNALLLDGVSDPGNLGTIFRTAAACGFCDIYLLDTADIYSPKVVRATLGTLFKVRAHQIDEETAIMLCGKTSSAALDMGGENILVNKPQAPILFVSGNEAHGVRDCLKKNAKHIYSLPMQNDVESLNVAVATAVAMYQSI